MYSVPILRPLPLYFFMVLLALWCAGCRFLVVGVACVCQFVIYVYAIDVNTHVLAAEFSFGNLGSVSA